MSRLIGLVLVLPSRVGLMATLDSTNMGEFAVRRFTSVTLIPPTNWLALELIRPVLRQ